MLRFWRPLLLPSWLYCCRFQPAHCTKIYPIALMCTSPLSGDHFAGASFPHELDVSWCPAVPNPILESGVLQSLLLSAIIPILALARKFSSPSGLTLNPSLEHPVCREAVLRPISFFHMSRPSVVALYWPSAISEYRELACLLMVTNVMNWPGSIERQILVKGVFQ